MGENKMCLIYVRGPGAHAMALEVRKQGFYIYNSWKNSFSNSWFSGLTNSNEFNLSPKMQNMFHEYKTKCGLGKRLTKIDVKNCLIDLVLIFHVLVGKDEPISFDFACQELNDH